VNARKTSFVITLFLMIFAYALWSFHFNGYSSKGSGEKYVLQLNHSAMSWENLTDLGSSLYYEHKYFESIEVNKIGLAKARDTYGNQSREYAESAIILAVLYSTVGDMNNKLLFEPWMSKGTGLGTAHGIRIDYDMRHSPKATTESIFLFIGWILAGMLLYFVMLPIVSLVARSKLKTNKEK
jgi:hypothetical protein